MFWFKLAGHLGATVGELKNRMGAAEFVEWMAYYRLEPFGPERVDVAVAGHSALVANMNRKQGKPAFKLKEFLPKFGRPILQLLEFFS